MADQTPAAGTPLPLPPKIPGGQEAYDMIMRDINPELTSANLQTLDAKYKDETPEQRIKRADRYTKDFEEFAKRSKAFKAKQDTTVSSYKRQLRTATEARAGSGDATRMQDLESTFNAA
jgi:murein tripeptide amidase MpaA